MDTDNLENNSPKNLSCNSFIRLAFPHLSLRGIFYFIKADFVKVK